MGDLSALKKSYYNFLNQYKKLQQENERLREVLRDFRDNWDCDQDSHKYGTTCRSCQAKKALRDR